MLECCMQIPYRKNLVNYIRAFVAISITFRSFIKSTIGVNEKHFNDRR
jgi:hypothetical protein